MHTGPTNLALGVFDVPSRTGAETAQTTLTKIICAPIIIETFASYARPIHYCCCSNDADDDDEMEAMVVEGGSGVVVVRIVDVSTCSRNWTR